MLPGGAQRINARHNRADRVTAIAAGRYVGDCVDKLTHRFLPCVLARRADRVKNRTLVEQRAAIPRVRRPERSHPGIAGAPTIKTTYRLN
jgi:hypothetical protein